MSEVSRLIIKPSLDGTFADSLRVCVWIDISLFVFSGLMRWIPSVRLSPVDLPEQREHANSPGPHSGYGTE